MRYEGQIAETVTIRGHGGYPLVAYLARPFGAGPYANVLVIHHGVGWDEATKEITRRFAHHGYIAICPNLYAREGADLSPDDAAAAARGKNGVPDEQFLGDVAGAIAYMRDLPTSNQKVGTIGYCSGGRQSFLAACNLDVQAAVDCYGGFVAEPLPEEYKHLNMRPILDQARNLRCPLLGLFGVEDKHPAPEHVKATEEELKKQGKAFDFHTFEGAGHGFFATDRAAYRVEAANEGWKLIFDFFGRYLA
ncbi:MAG TPA: dienelactone hydrolase family protein [Candidatus Dormibacteraeota bacterium]|nr:dienelactone hydrolase family protein [Candidatus Dormibacteraeota bacterium]